MLIFLADGQLGNQIFQYMFLKTIQKDDEKIIVSGFEELEKVFDIDNIINLNKKNRWIRAFLFKIVKPILTFLSDKNIISTITINHENVLYAYTRETAEFTKNIGKLKNITFVKLGFFQSEKFFDKNIINNLQIRNQYLQKAQEFLDAIPVKNHKVFIHIRRGDYKDFTVYGKSTLLPMSYFHNQIKWFSENRKDCFFIFLSDDTEFIEKEFNDIENKIISTKNHFGTDLAIMTLCESAILSPSSFGWWGSYLMENKDIVFAPKYWLGFNSKVEYQTEVIASFFKEVEIK